jgi:uncharacterized membrane protein YhaH (DUF805 family)
MIEEFIELVKSTTKWSGRFDRRQYVIVFFGINLMGMIIGGFSMVSIYVVPMYVVKPGGFMDLLFFVGAMVLVMVWLVVSVIISVGAGVRRFHDLDLSGWYYLLFFIPFINFLTFLYLVFKPGKEVGET